MTSRPRPQPSMARRYEQHFRKFTAAMTALPMSAAEPPIAAARCILAAIARSARPKRRRVRLWGSVPVGMGECLGGGGGALTPPLPVTAQQSLP